MQKITTTLLLILIATIRLYAQQAIVGTGGNATSGSGSISYSIGQVVFKNLSSATGSVYQGVQQPFEFFVTSIKNDKNITLELSVYPNPTVATVTLKIEQYSIADNLSYYLFDINGRLLLQKNITNSQTLIPMENLAAAAYFLKISNPENELQTFKIIKNQ